MSKRNGTLTVICSKHGILWWLLIGWWWRPIKLIFWYTMGSIFGFKKIKIVKMYK